MKKIFVIICLLTLSVIDANAQNKTDIILAKGKPPLTQVLVDQMQLFFEWALDGKFNNDGRLTLTRIIIAKWKSGNQSEIDETVKLMAIPSSLNNLTLEIQKALHDTIQAGLIGMIQKNPDDTLLKLLAGVRKSGDVLNQPSNGVIPARHSLASTINVSNLAGEWLYRIRGSSITFKNDVGGYAPPSGEMTGYKLRPDGTYENGYLLSSSLYSCNLTIFGFATGIWGIVGDTLVFRENISTLTSRDNCHQDGNYEKKRELKHYYYVFRLERDEYGPKIVFLHPDGTRTEYYQQEPGKMGW